MNVVLVVDGHQVIKIVQGLPLGILVTVKSAPSGRCQSLPTERVDEEGMLLESPAALLVVVDVGHNVAISLPHPGVAQLIVREAIQGVLRVGRFTVARGNAEHGSHGDGYEIS